MLKGYILNHPNAIPANLQNHQVSHQTTRYIAFSWKETRPVAFHNKSVSSNTSGVYFFLESTMAYKAKESVIFFFDSFQLKQGKGPFKLDTECETESIIYHEITFSVAS